MAFDLFLLSVNSRLLNLNKFYELISWHFHRNAHLFIFIFKSSSFCLFFCLFLLANLHNALSPGMRHLYCPEKYAWVCTGLLFVWIYFSLVCICCGRVHDAASFIVVIKCELPYLRLLASVSVFQRKGNKNALFYFQTMLMRKSWKRSSKVTL